MTSDLGLFGIFLLIGFAWGALWGFSNHFVYWLKHHFSKVVFRFLFDFILPVLACLCLIYFTNTRNFGQIRWFFVFAMLIGLLLERKTIGKLFALLNAKLYNITIKTKTKFLATKLGKRLSK